MLLTVCVSVHPVSYAPGQRGSKGLWRWAKTQGLLGPVPSLPPAPPHTWANLAAFPCHFLWVVAGVLGGAGHTLAVLVAILASAQDAGQGAEGAEGRVPHLTVRVCLPPMHAGWSKEGRKGGGSEPRSWPVSLVLKDPTPSLSQPYCLQSVYQDIKPVPCP
jgi:hypothetical protein